jgi:hypothetical protein
MGTREGTTTRSGNIKSAGGGGAGLANRPQFEGHLTLNQSQTTSVLAYQEGAAAPINRVLRGQTKLPLAEPSRKLVADLDAAIGNSRINRPTLLRRAFQAPAGLKAGMVFNDGGFGSFSVDRVVTRRFISKAKPGEVTYVLRVRAPAGTKGLYVQGVPGASYHHTQVVPEHEILRGRGSAYTIRRARKIKSGPLKGLIALDAEITT